MIGRCILAFAVVMSLLCLSTGTAWTGEKSKAKKAPATSETKSKAGSPDGCCMDSYKASKGAKEECETSKGVKSSTVKDGKGCGGCDEHGAKAKTSTSGTPEKK